MPPPPGTDFVHEVRPHASEVHSANRFARRDRRQPVHGGEDVRRMPARGRRPEPGGDCRRLARAQVERPHRGGRSGIHPHWLAFQDPSLLIRSATEKLLLYTSRKTGLFRKDKALLLLTGVGYGNLLKARFSPPSIWKNWSGGRTSTPRRASIPRCSPACCCGSSSGCRPWASV